MFSTVRVLTDVFIGVSTFCDLAPTLIYCLRLFIVYVYALFVIFELHALTLIYVLCCVGMVSIQRNMVPHH